jgi:predicted RNase H-like HicB family nuclease
MKIKIVIHQAEEGGFWAEVPAIPGCATQGDSMEELMQNLHGAIVRMPFHRSRGAGTGWH